MKPLIGDVIAQFTYGRPEDYAEAIEAARLEQEAMVGYPLVTALVRQTHTKNEKGHDVYEVFATFAPATELPQTGEHDA